MQLTEGGVVRALLKQDLSLTRREVAAIDDENLAILVDTVEKLKTRVVILQKYRQDEAEKKAREEKKEQGINASMLESALSASRRTKPSLNLALASIPVIQTPPKDPLFARTVRKQTISWTARLVINFYAKLIASTAFVLITALAVNLYVVNAKARTVNQVRIRIQSCTTGAIAKANTGLFATTASMIPKLCSSAVLAKGVVVMQNVNANVATSAVGCIARTALVRVFQTNNFKSGVSAMIVNFSVERSDGSSFSS